jgi:hypothetical protein
MSTTSMIQSRPKTSIAIGALALIVAIVVTFVVANKIAPVSSGLWGPVNESDGIAIKGYDAVSYTCRPGNAWVRSHRLRLGTGRVALRI